MKKYLILILLFISCSKDEDMRLFVQSLTEGEPDYITRTELSDLITATVDGGILDLAGKVVIIDKTTFTINKNITIINGGFKRDDTPIATTTTNLNIGGGSFDVDDILGFSVGNKIQVIYGQSMNEHAGITGVASIISISGNTITTSPNTAVRFAAAGSKLIWSYMLLGFTEGKIININNCTFYGNKINNNHTYDWKLNSIANVFDGHIIQNCKIQNSPGESFFVKEGAQILDNNFSNLNGSAVHFSNAVNTTIESVVTGNVGDGICQQPLSVNGHNEGAFTFSNNSQFLKIEDNNFKNGGEGCYGSQGLDDFNITVQNNTWDNFKEKVKSITGGHSDPIDTSLDTFTNTPNGT